MSKATARMERAVHSTRLHVRSAGDDDHQVGFAGYASTVGQSYSVRDWLGEYEETVHPGAFRKTLLEQAGPDGPGVPLLIDHDSTLILASTKSGTSRLAEDRQGLRNEADLDRRQTRANDLIIAMERGDLDQMSFSFRAITEDWNHDYTDRLVRELQLFDTSVVTYPANPATTAALRSAAQDRLGREGVWRLSELRRDLPALTARQDVADQDELLEGALRVFADTDQVVSERFGPQYRGRGLLVVDSLVQMRKGKVLNAANQGLLQNALDALAKADGHHQAAAASITTVLDSASGNPGKGSSEAAKKAKKFPTKGGGTTAGNGTANGTPPGNGNPINPQDGAGPRSAVLRRRRREQELEAFRRGEGVETAPASRGVAGRRREQEIEEFKHAPATRPGAKIEWNPKEFERQLKKVKAEAAVRHGTASLDALELLRLQHQRDGFHG